MKRIIIVLAVLTFGCTSEQTAKDIELIRRVDEMKARIKQTEKRNKFIIDSLNRDMFNKCKKRRVELAKKGIATKPCNI